MNSSIFWKLGTASKHESISYIVCCSTSWLADSRKAIHLVRKLLSRLSLHNHYSQLSTTTICVNVQSRVVMQREGSDTCTTAGVILRYTNQFSLRDMSRCGAQDSYLQPSIIDLKTADSFSWLTGICRKPQASFLKRLSKRNASIPTCCMLKTIWWDTWWAWSGRKPLIY